MDTKSSNTTPPAASPGSALEPSTEVLKWQQTLEAIVKNRVKLGEYNTDSQDILLIAQAVEFLLKQQK